jgi:polyisoprenoid-binding protein YceI
MSLTTAPALPEVGTWQIDAMHSTIRFGITHHGIAAFRGGFTGVTGSYDGASGVLSGSVAVGNIDLQGVDLLREHMLSPGWFDAERCPTISFRSDALELGAGGKLRANGKFTLKGVTKPVTATGSVTGPVSVTLGDKTKERVGISLSTTIDRRDFDLDANSEVAAGILNVGWDVAIDVVLELDRV